MLNVLIRYAEPPQVAGVDSSIGCGFEHSAAKPARQSATVEGQIQSLRQDGIRNGFLTISTDGRGRKTWYGGVYIGSKQYVILDESGEVVASKNASFDPAKPFQVSLTADLVKKSLTLTVDGESVSTPLPPGAKAAHFAGIGMNNTATRFTGIQIEAN